MKLWSKLLIIGKNNEHGKDIMLILELCLCTPFFNATLERFFGHLKVVKTQLRSNLSAESLKSFIRIRMKGLSLKEFNQDNLEMPGNVPIFGIIPKHAFLISVNEKNIPRENPSKEKEYNLISMNL